MAKQSQWDIYHDREWGCNVVVVPENGRAASTIARHCRDSGAIQVGLEGRNNVSFYCVQFPKRGPALFTFSDLLEATGGG